MKYWLKRLRSINPRDKTQIIGKLELMEEQHVEITDNKN